MGKNKRKRGFQNKSEILVAKKKSVIENLRTVNKSNGLIVGTNAVLRNLEKKELSAAFICSDKACTPIFRAVSFWCRETTVPFFVLEEEDRNFLSSEIPASVTYGIKKDSMHLHPQLGESLKQFKVPKIQKLASDFESNVDSDDLKDISPKFVPMRKEKENFACHKKHSPAEKESKKKIEAQEDFLAICSSSDSEEEFIASKCYQSNDSGDFPDYRSVKWKDSELIIK